MSVFINHTNHPSAQWSESQRQAAEEYGEIVDVAFPVVDPQADSADVANLAKEQAEKILAMDPAAVLCQGEFGYTYRLVERLQAAGVTALHATSERIVSEITRPDGGTEKISTFRFVRFRHY